MSKQVKVVQKEGDEVPTEVLADAIVAISAGIRKLRAGRLTDKALFLLVQHASPIVGQHPPKRVGLAEIKAVFDGIDSLERVYLKKKSSAGDRA